MVGAGNPAPQDKLAFADGTYPFFRTSDVGKILFGEISSSADLLNNEGRAKLRLVPAGTILMPKSGASTFLNHRVITTVDGYVSSHLATITPEAEQVDRRYLLYALDRVRAQDLLPENSYPSLNLGLIKSINIPLPPLEEQRRIVAVLDEAFEGLARARENTEANLASARELFENSRENVLNSVAESAKLDDLIEIKHGFAFKSANFRESGHYVVLTPGNYHETGGYRDRGSKQKYYSGEVPRDYLLNRGDLLVAMTEQAPGLLGSCIIVPEDDRFLHNQRLGLITRKSGTGWEVEYMYHLFNLKAFRQALSDTCSGATVRHTSPSRIQAVTVPYTSEPSEQLALSAKIFDLQKKYESIERHYTSTLQDLADLRQSLLRQAFAGALT